jgi:hypothetical protein
MCSSTHINQNSRIYICVCVSARIHFLVCVKSYLLDTKTMQPYKEPAMSGDIEQHVDTNSAEFKQGVAAGLNVGKDLKNWEAGNELGLELKEEVENDELVSKSLSKEFSTPLFMSDSPEGNQGNAQDEKDETEE